jgi:cytochrome c556
MKKAICVLVLLTFLTGIGIASAEINIPNAEQISQHALQQGMKGFIDMFEQVYRLFMRLSLPQSLDNIYNESTPETPSGSYIPEMFKMAEPMIGITTDVQEGDMTNATVNFNQFKAQYIKVSKMVPKWEGYWDIKLVNKLGADLKKNNVPAVFQDVGAIGQGCSKCHANEMPQVWAKYYWKDFDTVNVSTPEGNLSWTDAMTKYLDGAYSGTGSNIREGKQQDALNSSMLFESMMLNFKQACNNCHKTPRYYFVSDDVMANVTQMKNDIQTGNLADAETIREQLGETCIKCHIIHMPAQDMKDKMEK